MNLPRTALHAILAALLLAPVSSADSARLLTGDSNDDFHRRSSDLKDISANGNFVLFTSQPPTSGSTPGIEVGGLYLRRLSTGSLTFVGDPSVAFSGVGEATLSDDGRYLAWRSTSGNHIYWRDWQSGVTRHVTAGADSQSREPKISGDGRYVAFISAARNLIADSTKLPVAGRAAIYVYDSQTQTTTIASLAPDGSAIAGIGAAAFAANSYDFSSDGRFVVYATDATNAHPDRATMTATTLCICRRELSTGTVLLLNRNASGIVADGSFGIPRINSSGNRVSFTGAFVGIYQPGATMLASAPSHFGSDLYVKDVNDGDVWLASKTNDGSAHGGAFGTDFAISDDGASVSFASSESDLVADSDPEGGGGGSVDIFRADLAAGGAVTTTLITRSFADPGNVGYRAGPYMPGNGSYIAFTSDQSEQLVGSPLAMTSAYQGFGVGTFPDPVTTTPTYGTWAETLPEGERGPEDNPSGDGIPNLTKYFTGMDAAVPDRRFLPVMDTATAASLGLPGGDPDYLTLAVRIRRDLPAGYTWTVRTAHNLADLEADPGAAIPVGVPLADGDFEIHLFRFPTPMTGRGFMNVKFELPAAS